MTLPKANRLRRRQHFSRVYQQGRRSRSQHLTLRSLKHSPAPRPQLQSELADCAILSDQPSRIGIAVSQKVSKRAVLRNRIKRQLKTAIAQFLHQFPVGWDLVIVVHPQAVQCDYGEFLQELKQLLFDAEVLDGHSRGCLL